MKEITKDFLAVELVIIAAALATAIALCFLLNNVGITVPIRWVGGALYFFRWLYWAIQHCRSRSQFHATVRRSLTLIGLSASAGGALLVVKGLGGILIGVLGLGLFFGGLILVVWSHKEFGIKEAPVQSSTA